MILYFHPYSQHSRRVVALLETTGLAYELRPVALDANEHHSAEYLRVNPNHQVPTLLDGDVRVHESNAILRYLCVKYQLDDWYPSDPKRRARLEQWLDWNQCRLSPAVVDVVLHSVFLGDKGDQTAIERGCGQLRELLPILEAGLSEDFLTGATPTIADLSIASNLTQLAIADVESDGVMTRAWFARVNGLDGYQRALPRAA